MNVLHFSFSYIMSVSFNSIAPARNKSLYPLPVPIWRKLMPYDWDPIKLSSPHVVVFRPSAVMRRQCRIWLLPAPPPITTAVTYILTSLMVWRWHSKVTLEKQLAVGYIYIYIICAFLYTSSWFFCSLWVTLSCVLSLNFSSLAVALRTTRFNIKKNSTWCLHCVYVFCTDLRTNSNFLPYKTLRDWFL
jgi:hypothetical protein